MKIAMDLCVDSNTDYITNSSPPEPDHYVTFGKILHLNLVKIESLHLNLVKVICFSTCLDLKKMIIPR